MKRKRYKFDYGFYGYECPNFYKVINPFLYKPAQLVKHKLNKKIKKEIKYIVIDASLWNRMKAYFNKRVIALTYGFYDLKYNKIFINLPVCGIKAYKDCTISPPTSNTLKRVSQIITHEYIHYLFQNNTNTVLSRTESILKTFYRTYWSAIVQDELLPYLSRSHFLIAISTNKNIISPILGSLTKNQLSRFISILNMINTTRQDLIKDKNAMQDTVTFIESFIFKGSFIQSSLVEENILKSYRVITDGYPKDLQVGQELLFASEILSVCANITTSKSENIIKRIFGAVS